MTVIGDEVPRLKDEEVLPLMHTLQLEGSSISTRSNSSTGSDSKGHAAPLKQRLKLLLKGFSHELLAIALGASTCLGWLLQLAKTASSQCSCMRWAYNSCRRMCHREQPFASCTSRTSSRRSCSCTCCKHKTASTTHKVCQFSNSWLSQGPVSLRCAASAVYFVQGILRLSSLAVTFFLKDNLKMEPTQVGWLGVVP